MFLSTSEARVRLLSAFFVVCFLTCESVKLLHGVKALVLLNSVFCANG